MTPRLQVGDQVRLRRRGGAVAVIYQVTLIDEQSNGQRMVYLESPAGKHRTAHEDDLVVVTPANAPQ